jgi:4a-hydroxytetrahydrobiopterin dehydratase
VSGTPRVLDDAAAAAALAERAGPAWTVEDGTIRRQVRCASFPAALTYVAAVGAVAEAAGHHPDIDIRYDVVLLRLRTHSVGGLTELDVDLAARLDEIDPAAP